MTAGFRSLAAGAAGGVGSFRGRRARPGWFVHNPLVDAFRLVPEFLVCLLGFFPLGLVARAIAFGNRWICHAAQLPAAGERMRGKSVVAR